MRVETSLYQTPTQEAAHVHILALSGAGEHLLLALRDRSGQLRFRQQGLQHNEQLAALCSELCDETGLAPSELDAVAVDLGPGSFTGQRISLSFAKGLGFALSRPLLGLDSFALWRACVQEQAADAAIPLLVLIDGRKRRFYARLFHSRDMRRIQSEQSIAETWDLGCRELSQVLLDRLPFRVSGPGAPLFLEELAELSQDSQVWQNLGFCSPPEPKTLAENMLELARHEYEARRYLKASDGPLYLRKSDAEEQRGLRN